MKRYFDKWRKESPKNNDNNYSNGSQLLEKAILRIAHKDPLKALHQKEETSNIEAKVLKILGIKDRYIKYHWRDYFNKWKNQVKKQMDKELQNK